MWGFTDDQGLSSAFGGAVGVMYYAAMQVAFGRGDSIDRLDVAVAPHTDAAQVASALQAALGSGFVVERASRTRPSQSPRPVTYAAPQQLSAARRAASDWEATPISCPVPYAPSPV